MAKSDRYPIEDLRDLIPLSGGDPVAQAIHGSLPHAAPANHHDAARAAALIHQQFVLIPRADTQTVSCPDVVPAELFGDPAALEVYAVQRAADLIRTAAVDGLLVISRPEWQIAHPAFPGLDMGVPDGYVPVVVRATAWRLPDQDEIAPSGELAPPTPPG